MFFEWDKIFAGSHLKWGFPGRIKYGSQEPVMDILEPDFDITDTPQTLAEALMVTPQTINAWHRNGIIPSVFRIDRRMGQ